MKTIIDIIGDPTSFLDSIFQNLEKDKVDVANCELDHICYRVETLEKYISLKEKVGSIANLLTESLINNRPIATFKLEKPIIYKSRNIYLLEIPAPKKNSFYKEGFEHVEFVINESLSDWINLHQNITFDTKGMTKKVNPDVRIDYGNFSVKFHNFNLAYVIKYLD